MTAADYVIVGSGLTGATIARHLADDGRDVLVLERRAHAGGNLHEHVHPSGIPIHTYGPHYFRTNSAEIWGYVRRFGEFTPFEAVIKSHVEGRYENWPIAGSYVRRVAGDDWRPSPKMTAANFEDASLAMMPEVVYRQFVKGYTEKQWGVEPTALSAELASRFTVHHDDDPRLKNHRYQGLPSRGYSDLMARMLDGIRVELNCDYLAHREQYSARTLLIFTGPIDELFEFRLGRLKYRGQVREEEFVPEVDFVQPVVQVNHPDWADGPHIRTLEWKHLMPASAAASIRGTVLTRETTITPDQPDHYEYPFPDAANAALYDQYRQIAQSTPNLLVCGRLGEYRYYDMDQAIARALMLSRRIVAGELPKSA